MLIAYFTTDEVNDWAAKRLVAECGMTLCPMFLKDGQAGEGFDAMLFDWDFLPAAWRDEAMTQLATQPLVCPVAVHGYHLPEKLIAALRANGVQVRRRLQPRLFQELRRAVVQARLTLRDWSAAPTPPDGQLKASVGPSGTPPASLG